MLPGAMHCRPMTVLGSSVAGFLHLLASGKRAILNGDIELMAVGFRKLNVDKSLHIFRCGEGAVLDGNGGVASRGNLNGVAIAVAKRASTKSRFP